jgi:hypothetical protein
MTLEIDPSDLPELKLALNARIVILEGLMLRASKANRPPLSLRRQKVADILARLNALETAQ